jgi:hypothetical protein
MKKLRPSHRDSGMMTNIGESVSFREPEVSESNFTTGLAHCIIGVAKKSYGKCVSHLA